MFHIRFSSLAPCSVLCPLLAISQKAVFTSTSPRKKADAGYLRFQPSIDFAADGCYNRPAVDKNGSVSAGLPFAAMGLPRRGGPRQQQRRRMATATSSRSLAFAWMVHCETPPRGLGSMVLWFNGSSRPTLAAVTWLSRVGTLPRTSSAVRHYGNEGDGARSEEGQL
ncbi:hypothetical protein MGG_10804 [Pyricularia oryzae 70-15]|uniref:Secreted protein n=3 Tax=Pyricularia oryzae TaxID=318829 RepID=G4MVU6_PYRO7|nr:uncharacterized protein MGG_10804 [Pyricularia oryzae 70-15]EHA55814.1 hypothetical protein MGG_10804 [Pyricularia oryzae 70-15]ELQ40824.1 hypothetical protein OOU_Y34scaffold00337g4 [Pyricularia oryzae Y34]